MTGRTGSAGTRIRPGTQSRFAASLFKSALILLCLSTLACGSCVLTGLYKDVWKNPGPPTIDESLVGVWELMYQVDPQGQRNPPRPGTKTLIEFTKDGRVIFNRADTENSDLAKSKTGNFRVEDRVLIITDHKDNRVSWPYEIFGDRLVFTMPEDQNNKKSEYHWRRYGADAVPLTPGPSRDTTGPVPEGSSDATFYDGQ